MVIKQYTEQEKIIFHCVSHNYYLQGNLEHGLKFIEDFYKCNNFYIDDVDYTKEAREIMIPQAKTKIAEYKVFIGINNIKIAKLNEK